MPHECSPLIPLTGASSLFLGPLSEASLSGFSAVSRSVNGEADDFPHTSVRIWSSASYLDGKAVGDWPPLS